jgi:hypothetical protein
MTNEERMMLGASAINSFAQSAEGGDWGDLYDSPQFVLVDLLADLMHWAHNCNEPGTFINFEQALASARVHFEAEL